MSNKLVGFVSDEDFLNCVKYVCDAYLYATPDSVDMVSLRKNAVDPIKQVFDIVAGKVSYDDWLKNEVLRQNDKTLNNRIGEFHQKLLGCVDGWVDLGVGDESKIDLKKSDNSVFIELKNKYNTMNADANASCRRKLETISQTCPEAKAYWAFILSKNGSSGEKVWKKKGCLLNENIRVIWGKKVYELVTGDPSSLEKVWAALPKAISIVVKDSNQLDEKQLSILKEFFVSAFR